VPYRYRWPDAVRDEVLGRLLAENQRREGTSDMARGEDAERSDAEAADEPKKPAPKAKKGGSKMDEKQGSLL
jgi:hypothetical protein